MHTQHILKTSFGGKSTQRLPRAHECKACTLREASHRRNRLPKSQQAHRCTFVHMHIDNSTWRERWSGSSDEASLSVTSKSQAHTHEASAGIVPGLATLAPSQQHPPPSWAASLRLREAALISSSPRHSCLCTSSKRTIPTWVSLKGWYSTTKKHEWVKAPAKHVLVHGSDDSNCRSDKIPEELQLNAAICDRTR